MRLSRFRTPRARVQGRGPAGRRDALGAVRGRAVAGRGRGVLRAVCRGWVRRELNGVHMGAIVPYARRGGRAVRRFAHERREAPVDSPPLDEAFSDDSRSAAQGNAPRVVANRLAGGGRSRVARGGRGGTCPATGSLGNACSVCGTPAVNRETPAAFPQRLPPARTLPYVRQRCGRSPAFRERLQRLRKTCSVSVCGAAPVSDAVAGRQLGARRSRPPSLAPGGVRRACTPDRVTNNRPSLLGHEFTARQPTPATPRTFADGVLISFALPRGEC